MDDIQGNGDVDVDLNDDDDDMFKSARGLEPEPEKRDTDLFGDVDEPIAVAGNTSPDIIDKEIPLEDDDEKPFEVNKCALRQQLLIFIVFNASFIYYFSSACNTCNYIVRFFLYEEQVFFICRYYTASLC